MDKRKSLMEENVRRKSFHKHPTIIGAQAKSSHVIRNVGKSVPKTKLTMNDKSSDFRSILSPRLKTFPAEEIRRVRKSPRPNVFPFTAVLPAPSSLPSLPDNKVNSGQGDSLPQPILPPFIHNCNQSISQPHLSLPLSNQTQHSEVFINSNSNQRSPDRQTHRPYVPNITRNINPRPHITFDNQIIEPDATINCIGDSNPPAEPDAKLHNKFTHQNKLLDTSEYEKQPVGGRNAAIHRSIHLAKEKQSRKNNFSTAQQPILNQSNENSRYYHHCQQPTQSSNFYHDFCHTQQPKLNKIPTIGMTSPQNFIVNQPKTCRNNFDHYSNQQSPVQAVVRSVDNRMPQTMISQSPGFYHNCQYTNNISENIQHSDNYSSMQQQQEYPPRRFANNQKTVKKSLQFSPAMIRDQELLVNTMRQQGISEDIMKRQFDALLNEQKRQLIYENQLRQAEETSVDFDDVELQRRRRISKIDDEKPEWMMHITPPWIPYTLAEQLKNDSTSETKKCVTIDENFNHQQNPLPKYNYYVNNQQFEEPHPNFYQQLPHSIGDGEQQCENFDHYPNNNYTPCPVYKNFYTNPTSILKTRNNRSTMIKQKHQANNGLQDMKTIKKAMEELKNAQNHKGFEYLANLNKKEYRVQLNGIQNPDDPLIQNLPYRFIPEDEIKEEKKSPSANGLENNRNPNNPLPPSTLHLKNCYQPISEYPKRKDNNNMNNYNIMPAENKNRIVANTMMNEYQQNSSAFQNSTVFGNARCKNSIQAQVCCQEKGRISGPHNYVIANNLVRSNSLPTNIYSEYQQIRSNEFYGVPANVCNNHNIITKPNEIAHQYMQPNIHMAGNIYIPEQFLEAQIIGGIKYFVRKPENIQHPSTPELILGNRSANQPITFH